MTFLWYAFDIDVAFKCLKSQSFKNENNTINEVYEK